MIENMNSSPINILVGKNSSGKTLALEQYYESKKGIEDRIILFYGVNRNIKSELMDKKVLETYFENIIDFNSKRKNIESTYYRSIIEYAFNNYKNLIIDKFNGFFNLTLEESVLQNDLDLEEQSDGYYSMLVILSEVLIINQKFPNINIEVIIDEAESYLYPIQQNKLLMFLKEKMNVEVLIVSTHSPNIIKGIKGKINLITIRNLNDYIVEEVDINNKKWEYINEDIFQVKYYNDEFKEILDLISKLLYDGQFYEKLNTQDKSKALEDIEQIQRKYSDFSSEYEMEFSMVKDLLKC